MYFVTTLIYLRISISNHFKLKTIMIYLEKIKIVGNSYPGSQVLKQGFEIICGDVNIFVGNQGCGKSTILNLIQKSHEDVEITLSKALINNMTGKGVDSFFFDSEKDNPRMKDPELFTKANGENIGIGYGSALASRFKSHGEILESFVITPILKAGNCVIILDEPESGLSITNQFKMISAIKTAVDNNCQFFIASHCYPLIESFDVISLEHNSQMKGIEFINKIK